MAEPVRNILLITADQWRGDTLGCLGHPAASTPTFDRLAADGVLFARHFANATPCGPSRATMLTGLYACNHRSITNGTPLDARHRTLAELLRRGGFDPVLFGHTDTSVDPRTVADDDPRLLSYEGTAAGFRLEQPLGDDLAGWLDHLADRGYGRMTVDEAYATPLGAPARWKEQDSETAFMADRFLDWHGRQPAGERWAAHVSFVKPHPPLVAAAPWHQLIDEGRIPPPTRAQLMTIEGGLHPWLKAHLAVPFKDARPPGHPAAPSALDGKVVALLRRVYLGLVAEVDHHVGRIMEALRRGDQLDRTMVVVTADHGNMLGDHWMLGKAGFFPQAFHVPLLVRHPNGARGRRVEQFTEHVDLLPTVLDAAGLPVPLQADGHALSIFLTGDGRPGSWRRGAVWEHDFRDPVGKLYERLLGLAADECQLAARYDGRFAYVHFAALPPLLFDTAHAPGWDRSIAEDPQASPIVAQAARKMLSWRMSANERRLTGCQLGPGGLVGRYDPA